MARELSNVHPLIAVCALTFMIAAAVSDVRHRRISNRLNLSAAGTGLGLQLALTGSGGLVFGVKGLLVGLGLLFLPFAAGMIGGGDVKFVAAVGAFFGWKLTMVGLAAGVVLGGIVGAIALARHGRFRAAARGLVADLMCLSTGVRPTTLKSSEAVETVPYGVLLAMGMAGSLAVALFKEVPWVGQ